MTETYEVHASLKPIDKPLTVSTFDVYEDALDEVTRIEDLGLGFIVHIFTKTTKRDVE